MRRIVVAFAAILAVSAVQAQVKVGSNPNTLQAGSLLEMEAQGSRAGLKLAEVALTGTDDLTTVPVGAGSKGTLVYNTATAGTGITAVTPGFYHFNGTAWIRTADARQLAWSNVATNAPATADTQNIYQLGRVGIGTNNPKAPLEISSTTAGILIPRLDPRSLNNPAGWSLAIDTTAYFGGPVVNVGTASSPVWASANILLAAYTSRTNYSMGFQTNGGGFFVSSGLDYTGTGPSGWLYGKGITGNQLGSVGGYMFSDGGSFSITTFLPSSNEFATVSKANAFTVANNGNIGVGLAAPLAQVHLKAGSSGATDVQEFRMATFANSANAKIGFRQRLGFYGRDEYTSNEIYNAGIEVLYGDNIHFPTYPGRSSTNLLFLTGNRSNGLATEQMRITHAGDVGIGVTAPKAKLEVSGYIKVGSADASADVTPTAGLIRFNNTTGKFQGYDGTAWVDLN